MRFSSKTRMVLNEIVVTLQDFSNELSRNTRTGNFCRPELLKSRLKRVRLVHIRYTRVRTSPMQLFRNHVAFG